MARKRDIRPRPVELFRALPVVRDIAELVFEDENGVTEPLSMHTDVQSQAIPAKKKLNIPTPIVLTVEDYDKFLSDTYRQPAAYVKHTKKLLDEADPSTDYIAEPDDKEWLESNPRIVADKEVQKALTLEVLEWVITSLEKATGFGDPVSQAVADYNINQKYKWPKPVAAKVAAEVYQHWIAKRLRLKKPLVRRFWPQTSANDTNPHMVFRPREKERYKLRKHRKNDMESFRKLQQLRRDFERLRILLQLVVERERIKQATLEIQMEQFENTLRDMVAPGVPGRDQPYQFQLKFEHLLTDDYTASVASTELDGKLIMKLPRQPAALDAEEDARRKKRRTGTHKKRRGEEEEGSMVFGDDDLESLTEQKVPRADSALETRKSLPQIPGPAGFCRPQWPSFMAELHAREDLSGPRNLTEYLEDLILDQKRGIPARYKCRPRMGRGGRLVIDRIPVYDSDDEVEGTRSAPHITYIHPTMFSTAPALKEPPQSMLDPPSSALLMEIYNMSDSEDERVEFSRPAILPDGPNSRAAAADQPNIKFSLNV